LFFNTALKSIFLGSLVPAGVLGVAGVAPVLLEVVLALLPNENEVALGALVLGAVVVVLGAAVLLVAVVVPNENEVVLGVVALVLVVAVVVLGVVPKLNVDVVALLALVLGAVVLGVVAPNVNAGVVPVVLAAGVVLGAVVLGVVLNAVGAVVPKLKLGVVLGCVVDVPPMEGVVEAPNVVVLVAAVVEGTPNENDDAGAVLPPKEKPVVLDISYLCARRLGS
jgi:hypothetical protein